MPATIITDATFTRRTRTVYGAPMMPAANLTLKDEIAAYWSARAASFDASPGHGIAPGAEREAWLRLIAEGLGSLKGLRVLELASGTGEFTRLLVDAGAVVTGLDLSEGMLARARPKLTGRPASLFLGDAEDTREPAAHYDAVVCRHLVWTLPDPARAAAEWFRVLRPGGRLMVIDGDWVRRPLWGRVRQALGHAVLRLLDRPPEPIDWAAHERIMAQVHFSGGLRAPPLTSMMRDAGFGGIATGSIEPIRRAQRRAVGYARGLTIGGYAEFWMTAMKPVMARG